MRAEEEGEKGRGEQKKRRIKQRRGCRDDPRKGIQVFTSVTAQKLLTGVKHPL
jgi:hypothetical protein